MALAILELVDFGSAVANFNIDTGTNRNYVLKIGRNFQNRNGIDWIDDVTYSTAPATNENGGSLFRSTKQVAVPVSRFADGANFVQLFSFKGLDHISPAFSSVVEIPGRIARPPDRLPIRRSYRASMSLSTATFQSARRVPCRTATDVQAQGMSIDDVLASVVKLATPLVETLLNAKPNGAATADAGGGKNDALANVLAVLLRSILGDGKAPPAVAGAKSLSVNGSGAGNRFVNGALSHPFIFGIDDALIGALAGPILQMLPQLMNSANQRKIQAKQADNRLISDIVSDINRRMLLQQLANAQPANAGATPTSPELANLIQLLQQAPADAGAASPPATAQSLTMEPASGAVLSSRAVLGFAFADPLPWNGSPKPLFVKGAIRLRVRLNVGNPAPKSVLPRVILKVAFKDPADHSVLLEKTFKQKDVAANSSVALDFTADELAALPGNQPIDVVAEMRWRTAKNGEYKALGSSEIVLIGKYLLKSQGSTVSTEVELTDMTRFRPFWNKVWESPVLDSAGKATDDNARYLWELAANIKYSVLPSADHDANGLMETKLLKGPEDPESLSNRTSGRMKAGIELSLTELNKLLPLWNGQAMLEPVKLAALQTAEFAKANAGELITSVKLSGKAGERGMVWAIPVFNLTECTLSSIAKTDESGQVTALSDETIRFPLPVSVRLIGLKSRR